MRRFWAWFSEPVDTPRGWVYLALGFAFLAACDLIANFIVWLS